MSKEQNFAALMQFRTQYKRISQLSWTLNASERRFPLDDEVNEETLLKIYKSMIHDVEDIVENLKRIKNEN